MGHAPVAATAGTYSPERQFFQQGCQGSVQDPEGIDPGRSSEMAPRYRDARTTQVLRGQPRPGTLVLTPEIPGLYDAVSEIDWNAAFCFTGIFAFGKRNDCEE